MWTIRKISGVERRLLTNSALPFFVILIAILLSMISCTDKVKSVMKADVLSSTEITNEVIDDDNITAAVKRELGLQRGIFGDIKVMTLDGVVSLKGNAQNILTKERAVQVARMVKGVRAVVDGINISPTDVPDHEIEDHIKLAFYWDPAVEVHEVKVKVKDGVVSLYGEVDSWEEKELAATVAKGVKGVRELNNNIVFNFPQERSDSEIAHEIIESLKWDVLVDDALIDVIVKDGNVILTGTVGSASEKSQAKVNAWVTGVTSVDASQLKVARWSRDRDLIDDKYITKSDEEIREAVLSAFVHDPRVPALRPNVEVKDAVVTLTGTLNSLSAAQAAESDAYNVVGVKSVVNEIIIAPDVEKTDEQIENRIKDAIAWDPLLENYGIEVSVKDGNVVLKGAVDSYYEKYHAAALAAKTMGVSSVDDQLTVMAWSPYHYDHNYFYYNHPPASELTPPLSDEQIQKNIRTQLFWSPFVNEENIALSVSKGKVVLQGTVGSWREKEQAELEAFDGGALSVENNLVVEKLAVP